MQCIAITDGMQSDNIKAMVIDSNNIKINYFLPGHKQDADGGKWKDNTVATKEMSNMSTGICCFDGTFHCKSGQTPNHIRCNHDAWPVHCIGSSRKN